MKAHLRQSMAWLHTWVGLAAGWVLFFVFATGTPGYFQQEITRWMQPERAMEQGHNAQQVPHSQMLSLAMDRLEKVAPAAAYWRITLPHESLVPRGWQELAVRWEDMPGPGRERGTTGNEVLDPRTGAVQSFGIEPRSTHGGLGLYRMHYELRYMPFDWAVRIVGICTMLMLLAIVSGVITHKKIFTDFFTFRPNKGQRSWLDAHNAISVAALPFFLMITYSGLVFFLFLYMPAGRDLLYGSGPMANKVYYDELLDRVHTRLPLKRPQADVSELVKQAEAQWGRGTVATVVLEHREGEPPVITISRINHGSLDFFNPPKLRFDANTASLWTPEVTPGGSARLVQVVTLNLHEGLFVDIWGRWLFFLAGLMGCAMIGTGMVLWTVKRRRHHLSLAEERQEHLGLRLVETLNVATIAGLPLAIAAYFWANRLLPVSLVSRADWEIHVVFAVWLATLFYALARPVSRAWGELFWLGCLAYAAIPILNAITTERHLLRSFQTGDWVFVGFELTVTVLAAVLALMAIRVKRRLSAAHQARPWVPPLSGQES
ncbi:PepSY-associated TM helix domain-containing protein [Ottowia thiooxydans]|uniref:Iron-regulated membrane protein n=1 Tax=Ottowia thiooxydans TaxID=219182 RepID=A0ABV2Q5U7_9BURK